jgi:phosphoenolpyruvate carboxykinase (GTP)
MKTAAADILKSKLDDKHYKKLAKIKNQHLNDFVAKYIELCNPAEVFVSDDSPEDIAFIREEAVRSGEERSLAIKGHTIHFDGYHDQARDKKNTKFLLPKGIIFGPDINSMEAEEGLAEVYGFLKNSMQGHRLFICLFCLGPANSEFSLPSIQLTDSSYVAHSEYLLYRPGYQQFIRLGNSPRFFRFVHSSGELDGVVSKNVDKRRVYIDINNDIVYSVNTQYGGNTIGHKKLCMRLAINRASKEKGWLTEHMFLMGVHGPRGRVTYFTGAFPSLCGKTSTATLPGETIVGDDIAYLRAKKDRVRAVNVEKGMFGIIDGLNSKGEPIIWKALTREGEIIFSNILLKGDNNVYWNGKDGSTPEKGFNHSGEWFAGKKDAGGNTIPPSHKNARFTLDLRTLENVDPHLDDPSGVEVGGIIYGGRDSDTWVPVEESFDWTHGIITKGASLESETTAATLGQEGVRKFNPMANLDFLSVTLGRYLRSNLDFGNVLKHPPRIFSVNYFLKDDNGNFLNDKMDKRVWLKWMELRVHGGCSARRTPTGLIPCYEDIQKFFKEVLNKDYTHEDYVRQFTLRIPENIAKIDRIEHIYRTKALEIPDLLFSVIEEQKKRLLAAKEIHGDYVEPGKFERC